jgi:tRNA 2-selenouridine synthase
LPHALQMNFRPNDADVVEQAKALLAQLDNSALAVN